jgi:membrane-associated phospholipid phosphatase
MSKIYKSFFAFIIASLLFTSNIFSQQKYDFNQFTLETTQFVLKPLSWESNDFLTAGGIILGTAIIMPFDEAVKSKMMEDRSYENKGLMAFGTTYGDATPHLILGAGLLAHGYIAGNEYTKQFGFELLQAITYSGAVTLILKSAIGRGRPSAVDNAFTFSPFALTKGDAYQSLPSGHATVAFAVSTVFASKFSNGWLKALCYAPAFITAFSRVYNNRHWLSDVFLGGFIGHFVGKFVVGMHDSPLEVSAGTMVNVRLRL